MPLLFRFSRPMTAMTRVLRALPARSAPRHASLRGASSSSSSSSALTPVEYTQGNTALQITGLDDRWFRINGVVATQSILLLPKSFLLWSARDCSDINMNSLALIPLVFPTLEMLVIGCGTSMMNMDVEKRAELSEEFRKKGIVLEFMDTKNAVSTYNVLSAEDRHIGAALLLNIPPVSDDEKVDVERLLTSESQSSA
jgi:uncharacterized protein